MVARNTVCPCIMNENINAGFIQILYCLLGRGKVFQIQMYTRNIDILKAIGKGRGVRLVSCPTCGRTRIDLIGLVNQVDEALKDCTKPITVAVMGCVVNGPGEAREADIGIAGCDG